MDEAAQAKVDQDRWQRQHGQRAGDRNGRREADGLERQGADHTPREERHQDGAMNEELVAVGLDQGGRRVAVPVDQPAHFNADVRGDTGHVRFGVRSADPLMKAESSESEISSLGLG